MSDEDLDPSVCLPEDFEPSVCLCEDFDPLVCVCLVFEEGDVGGRVDPNELVPRRVGEAIGSTVGTLATLVNYPIGRGTRCLLVKLSDVNLL